MLPPPPPPRPSDAPVFDSRTRYAWLQLQDGDWVCGDWAVQLNGLGEIGIVCCQETGRVVPVRSVALLSHWDRRQQSKPKPPSEEPL